MSLSITSQSPATLGIDTAGVYAEMNRRGIPITAETYAAASQMSWDQLAANYAGGGAQVYAPASGPGTGAAPYQMQGLNSLGSVLQGALGPVGTILGGALGGPVGAALGGALGGAFSGAKPTGVATVTGAASGLVGGLLPGVISGLLPGGTTTTSSNGCGCGHKKRGPAPLASFFGGKCPCGTTLRRKPMARDICIKTPRMNVFNPRALARADRRVVGFARRGAAILKGMGFQVSRQRKPKFKMGKRRARR